jgi:hypothetical protein
MNVFFRFFSVLFILLFLAQTSYNSIVYIQFTIHQKYIAKELCKKRNEKNNKCKGACYLKAHLSNESKMNTINYLKDRIDLFFIFDVFSIQKNKDIQLPYFVCVTFTMPKDRIFYFFHPPA